MLKAQTYYPECPEALVISLARNGDRGAFEDLVRRRQSSIRRLMLRCCSDVTLADDLAQQVFFQVWLKLHALRKASAFNAWLKRLAVSVWLQYLRKHDALRGAGQLTEFETAPHDSPGEGMDLDQALATLPAAVRLCIVLSYQEGMSHREIAAAVGMPLGTVKSHIKRGTSRLQQLLSAYKDTHKVEKS